MKKLFLFTALFFCAHIGSGQVYVPMPTDSAVWRYRIYDIDYLTRVLDCILYVNGTDTVAPIAIGGNTYHKIMSRAFNRVVPNDSVPPITPVYANQADTYYGAIRESGKQVFSLNLSGEDLIFDFNAVVGDSIPAYSGKDKVVAIDSVLLGGIYHKRYLTTDSTYFVIEGVGSNRGLLPSLNDGSGNVQFFCFTDTPTVYSPDSAIACTYVYPIDYLSAIGSINSEKTEVNISPVPAYDVLHIATSVSNPLHAAAYNSIGQVVWSGDVIYKLDVSVAAWPKGLYCIEFSSRDAGIITKKVVVD